MTVTIHSEEINGLLNQIISYIGDHINMNDCPEGYLNSLNFTNGTGDGPCDDILVFKNKYGNDTTASFFLDYTGFASDLNNLFCFEFDSTFIIPTGAPYEETTFRSSFVGTYTLGKKVILGLKAKGYWTTYIPQQIVDEDSFGAYNECNPICANPCVCGVIAGLQAPTTNAVIWPTNSLSLNRLEIDTPGIITLEDATLEGVFSISISLSAPSTGGPTITLHVNNINLPADFYLYKIHMEQMFLLFSQFTTDFPILIQVPSFNITLNQNEVELFINKMMSDLNQTINPFLQEIIFHIINDAYP